MSSEVTRARARYLDAVKETDAARHGFTVRAEEMHDARKVFLKHPTRKNRLAYREAKATRAHRLRVYRRARAHRNDLKALYLAAKQAASLPTRLRALRVAESLVGVMEQGGNNQGPTVSKIIRANGGTGPEPWCGDFVAYCYRLAGSRAVTRAWASVYYLGVIAGLTTTRNPRAGDIVRFTFDHTGLFVKDNGDGTITTIEGNTGATGAVSDSKTGGDGVYRKTRSKSLVRDYLRVTR